LEQRQEQRLEQRREQRSPQERRQFLEQRLEERRQARDRLDQRGPGPRREEADQRQPRVDQLRRLRRETVEEGGRRTIIREPGNRTIIREGNRVVIRHDETDRLRRAYGGAVVRRERRGADEVVIVRRPNGIEIVTVYDRRGNLVRRVRRDAMGREIILIQNVFVGGPAVYEEFVELPPPVIRIRASATSWTSRTRPRRRSTRPSRHRRSSGSTGPTPSTRCAAARPCASGCGASTSTRSPSISARGTCPTSRRWRSPASPRRSTARSRRTPTRCSSWRATRMRWATNSTTSPCRTAAPRRWRGLLTEIFDVPAENLTTQGYGEQYLKIDTQEPERENRRVTVRRITPLLNQEAAR
jgi:hypothetical protein